MINKIHTSKKGIIATSNTTNIKYRVFKWKDLGNGKILCLKKERIKSEAI